MKENKYFTPINFWLPVLYVTVVGIFFSEESSYTVIMHQDQTDEWRGWMMMIILVYHYTGASQSVPIYMHIRLCISMHLFLLGYTHFTYAWQKGRTGIIRLMQVRISIIIVLHTNVDIISRFCSRWIFWHLFSVSAWTVHISFITLFLLSHSGTLYFSSFSTALQSLQSRFKSLSL